MTQPLEHLDITRHVDFKHATSQSRSRELTPVVLTEILPGTRIEGFQQGEGLRAYQVNSKGTEELVAVVRHPSWVSMQGADGKHRKFGGPRTEAHVEYLRGREFTPDGAARIALDVLDSLVRGDDIAYGALSFGAEREAWFHDRKTGAITPAPRDKQIELQQGLLETPLDPDTTWRGVTIRRARQLLEQEREYPRALILDTSVPVIGDWHDEGLKINEGPRIGPYVQATEEKLRVYMSHPDRYASDLFERMTDGKFDKVRDELEHTGWWFHAAAHLSEGLPHINGLVPLEFAIARADMNVSNFSSILEMLTASTPVALGKRAIVMGEDGQLYWARDTRAITRHFMDTAAQPQAFIRTPHEYRKRIAHEVGQGNVGSADRAAYVARFSDGTTRPVMHGSTRVRLGNGHGRIEYTGCGSAQILDESARNALLFLMGVGAYEAVAHQQQPVEYFGNLGFASFADLSRQQDLVGQYSMYGTKTQGVRDIIGECLGYAEYIGDRYDASPLVRDAVRLVRARVSNLLVSENDTPRTLDEYRTNPRGSISIVMQHMVEDGTTPLQLAHALAKFQHETAEDIVRAGGDLSELSKTHNGIATGSRSRFAQI